MVNVKQRSLGAADLNAINAATSAAVITSATDSKGATQPYVEDIDGMLAATFDVTFAYGSGGATLKVLIEMLLDDVNWVEVARLAFTTVSARKIINLSGLTPKTVPVVPGALSDDTSVDGIFGARCRASIISSGDYAGATSLIVRMQPR